MSTQKKHTFYPVEAVENELKEVPRGRFSERINELILKGLSLEKQEQTAKAYQEYDAALASAPRKKFEESSAKLMSKRAFIQDEDEVEDFV